MRSSGGGAGVTGDQGDLAVEPKGVEPVVLVVISWMSGWCCFVVDVDADVDVDTDTDVHVYENVDVDAGVESGVDVDVGGC